MGTGVAQRDTATVTGHHEALVLQSADPDLQALDRGVDKARGALVAHLLAEHVPGLERLAQFQFHTLDLDLAAEGEAELGLRLVPDGVEREAVIGEVAEDGTFRLPVVPELAWMRTICSKGADRKGKG